MTEAKKPSVLLYKPISEDADNGVPEGVQDRVREHFNIVWLDQVKSNPDLCSEIVGVFACGCVRFMASVVCEKISEFSQLKAWSSASAGLDYLDLDLMKKHNVRVGYIPQTTANVTADMALALMLSAARRFKIGMLSVDEPARYTMKLNLNHGVDVYSATIGILGLGRIGTEVARRAKGFHMPILYHNRNRRPEAEKELGCEYVSSLNDLLKRVDFLVTCCPLTAETRGIIGDVQLRLMKATAVLVNVGRGPLVNTEALVDALSNGRLFGAGLDVTDPEPLPAGHPLLKLDNCIVTPHWGSQTSGTRKLMEQQTLQNLINGVRGQPMQDEWGVNSTPTH